MITPAGSTNDPQDQAALSILAKVLTESKTEAARLLEGGATADKVLSQASASEQVLDAVTKAQGLHIDTTA
jgi:hypothetical protein